jgi:hypothetical protein
VTADPASGAQGVKPRRLQLDALDTGEQRLESVLAPWRQ